MSAMPQFSVGVRRNSSSRLLGDDRVGQIGQLACLVVQEPVIGLRIEPSRPVTRDALLKQLSGLVYGLVCEVGEEKARLALADYGLTLINDDDEGGTA